MLVKGSLFLLAHHRSGWRWQHVPLHHAIAKGPGATSAHISNHIAEKGPCPVLGLVGLLFAFAILICVGWLYCCGGKEVWTNRMKPPPPPPAKFDGVQQAGY